MPPRKPRPEVTRLSVKDELRFQAWAHRNRITDVDHPDSHYDYRGYWRSVKGADHQPGAHFPDTFKQHGHPTFSVESKYSTGPNDGGRWRGENFIPPVGPATADRRIPSDILPAFRPRNRAGEVAGSFAFNYPRLAGIISGAGNVAKGVIGFVPHALRSLASFTPEELRDPEVRQRIIDNGWGDPDQMLHEALRARGRGEPVGATEGAAALLKGMATMGYDLQRAIQGGALYERTADGQFRALNPDVSPRERAQAITEMVGNAGLLAAGVQDRSLPVSRLPLSTAGRAAAALRDAVGPSAILPQDWTVGQRAPGPVPRTPVGSLNMEAPAFQRQTFKASGAVSPEAPTYLRNRPVPGGFRRVSPEKFNAALDRFTNMKPDQTGFLTHRTPAEMRAEGMELYLNKDGNVGYGLHPATGDIRNVFNAGAPKGAGAYAVADAVSRGGRILDAFDTKLTNIYRDLGFTETARQPWNDQYRPAGWNESKYGRPDVVNMEFQGGNGSVVNPDLLYRNYQLVRRVRQQALGNPRQNAPETPAATGQPTSRRGPETQPSPIIGAAVRLKDGRIGVGANHWDAFERLLGPEAAASADFSALVDERGYQNAAGKFLTNAETKAQVTQTNQLRRFDTPEARADQRLRLESQRLDATDVAYPNQTVQPGEATASDVSMGHAGEYRVPPVPGRPDLEGFMGTGPETITPEDLANTQILGRPAAPNIITRRPSLFDPNVGAPNIAEMVRRHGRPESGSILNYVDPGTYLRDVPQTVFDLPSPKGASWGMHEANAREVLNLQNQFLMDAIYRGLELNRGGRGQTYPWWYNAEPVLGSAMEHLGPELGRQRFNMFGDFMKPTSINTEPVRNLRNASYQYYRTGNPSAPLFTEGYRPLYPVGMTKFLQQLEQQGGHMTQPKIEPYGEAWKGNWGTSIGDMHYHRALEALGLPYGAGADPGVRWGPYNAAFTDFAHDLQSEGLIPEVPGRSPAAPAQATMWGGMGEHTGVKDIKTARPTIWQMFEDAAHRSARHLGMKPNDFLHHFWNREVPLF